MPAVFGAQEGVRVPKVDESRKSGQTQGPREQPDMSGCRGGCKNLGLARRHGKTWEGFE